MEDLGRYILSIALAAIAIGIFSSILDPKGATTNLIRFVGGVFLIFTVIHPIKNLDIPDFSSIFADVTFEGEAASRAGEEMAISAMGNIIIRDTETYILDKAESLGLDVEATVAVSLDSIPIPVSVRGEYTGSQIDIDKLREIIEQDLSIPKEQQLWTQRK
jgi:hypothetical protein